MEPKKKWRKMKKMGTDRMQKRRKEKKKMGKTDIYGRKKIEQTF